MQLAAPYEAKLEAWNGSMANVRFRCMNITEFSAARRARDELQQTALRLSGGRSPLSFAAECLVSCAFGGVNFPMPLALGQAWDATLVERVYEAIAAQGRAQGADVAFAPVLNLFLDPRFGRGAEGFARAFRRHHGRCCGARPTG